MRSMDSSVLWNLPSMYFYIKGLFAQAQPKLVLINIHKKDTLEFTLNQGLACGNYVPFVKQYGAAVDIICNWSTDCFVLTSPHTFTSAIPLQIGSSVFHFSLNSFMLLQVSSQVTLMETIGFSWILHSLIWDETLENLPDKIG